MLMTAIESIFPVKPNSLFNRDSKKAPSGTGFIPSDIATARGSVIIGLSDSTTGFDLK